MAPIPFAISANDFTDQNEIAAINAAVNTWNTYYVASQSPLQVLNFSYSTEQSPNVGMDCTFDATNSGVVKSDGSAFVQGRVVSIHKVYSGFSTYNVTGKGTIGATQFCHKDGTFNCPAFLLVGLLTRTCKS